jgi:hypothetical protein
MATNDPNYRPESDVGYPLGLSCLWWWLIGMFFLIIFFGGGWWWGGWYGPPPWGAGRYNGQQAVPGNRAVPTNPQVVKVPPAEFLGRDVTLRGKVDTVINPNAFTLAPAAPDGHSLLVVSSGKAAHHPALKKGDMVEVKGDVRLFDTTLEKENQANLPANLTAQYVDRPAVVATSVAEASHS